MRIKSIKFRNIGSFGNKLNTIEFPDDGGLWMVTGKNGFGKCLAGDTTLELMISNKNPYLFDRFYNFIN